MTIPFTVVHRDGVAWVDRKVDQAFRKALMAGVPTPLRAKMQLALAATPDAGAYAHSQRYFGAELPNIMARVAPLIENLNLYLTDQHGLKGLFDWLNVTGYGNDYRMISVFDRWATEHRLADPVPETVH